MELTAESRSTQAAQILFRGILERRFAELRTDNPAFSLRRFSRVLDQNPAVISQIFSGKRKVSRRLALELAERAGSDPQSLEVLQRTFDDQAAEDTLKFGRHSLPLAQYDLIADWYYYAILSLAEIPDFHDDPKWISKRLGLSRKVATKALKVLKEHGLLVEDESGRLKASGTQLCTTDGIVNLALRARHAANLQSAKQSLLEDPLDVRDFSFITLAGDPKRLAEAKRRIRRFMNELCQYLEAGDKAEVFEMCFQLFPRTKISRKFKNRSLEGKKK